MGRRDGSGQNVVGMTIEDIDTANGLMQQNFQIEDTENSNMQEFSEVYHEELRKQERINSHAQVPSQERLWQGQRMEETYTKYWTCQAT